MLLGPPVNGDLSEPTRTTGSFCGLFLALQLRKLQNTGMDKALAGVFHSPEPAAHSLFTDDSFTVPPPHTELKQDQLHAFTSQALQKKMGGKKIPTAVISCDKQSKSSAANQRANLYAAGLACLLPSLVVAAEMESSTRITSVPEGCTESVGHTDPGPYLLQNKRSGNEVNLL